MIPHATPRCATVTGLAREFLSWCIAAYVRRNNQHMCLHVRARMCMRDFAVCLRVGCQCKPSKLEGHHTLKESQLNLHNFYTSQAEECVIAVKGKCPLLSSIPTTAASYQKPHVVDVHKS